MKIIEIVAIVLSAVIVVGVIIRAVINKKQGKCSCGCEDCPHKNVCGIENKEK